MLFAGRAAGSVPGGAQLLQGTQKLPPGWQTLWQSTGGSWAQLCAVLRMGATPRTTGPPVIEIETSCWIGKSLVWGGS